MKAWTGVSKSREDTVERSVVVTNLEDKLKRIVYKPCIKKLR